MQTHDPAVPISKKPFLPAGIVKRDGQRVAFDPRRDIAFLGERSLPEHPNAMRMAAFDAGGGLLREAHYFSVGGGFVVEGGAEAPTTSAHVVQLPFAFSSGDQLIAHAVAQFKGVR